jgi:hypothetical protein
MFMNLLFLQYKFYLLSFLFHFFYESLFSYIFLIKLNAKKNIYLMGDPL